LFLYLGVYYFKYIEMRQNRYKRNNYKYVSGKYVRECASNKHEEVSKISDEKNKKIKKKLKGLDKKFDTLK
jgi:hypothetical protein